ncbi:MAG: hypothetical protein GKB98_02465 [Methanobacteriales archaeon]|nr:hypothetical protein [Methanobacteriales archaeon]
MGDSAYVTYCRICNAKVPANSSFCIQCGHLLTNGASSDLTCASCGENLSEEYQFCPECGEKITSIGTCPRCTARIKPGTKLCTECGLDLDEKSDALDLKEDKGEDTVLKKTGLISGLGSLRNKNKETPVLKKRYLVCDTCRGYYQLQRGEEPEDFSDECECGGKLGVQDSKEGP